ncbi:MAG: hypothetical protein M1378_00535 [Bacteroidetes bacterium]|nr:hypothetical protein [Bacteroidota bacterium]
MKGIQVLAAAVLILLCIVAYKIVFVPTSMTMQTIPNQIFATSSRPVVVKATLTNGLGLPVPFEHLAGKFVVYQGSGKIDIIRTESDRLVFKTRGDVGRLVIYFYTTEMPFPVEVVLDIQPSSIAGLVPRHESTMMSYFVV